jgi:hypothetical protein
MSLKVDGSTTPMTPIDPSVALAAALLDVGELQASSARTRANSLSMSRAVALSKARESLKRAQEAREDGGFFKKWGSELQTAAVVASVTASVATCGAGAPFAVCALTLLAAGCSAGSYAMKQTGADGKLCKLSIGGTDLTINWSDAVALGGIVAGGGAILAAPAAAPQGAGTAAKTAQAAAKSEGVSEACRVVHNGASLVQVGASAGRAYFTVREGISESRAAKSDAVVADAHADLAKADSETKDIIDAMKDFREVQSKIVEVASSIVETRSHALSAILEKRF